MNDFELKLPKPKIEAKFISALNNTDIEELCDATEDAILVDGGFGWINPPQRKKLVDYWKGVLLVPERLLIVGKIDNVMVHHHILGIVKFGKKYKKCLSQVV